MNAMDTLLAIEDPSLQEVLGLWSPPDSGSETPYSPPEDGSCKNLGSGGESLSAGSLSQDSSPEMISHSGQDKQHPSQHQQHHPYVPPPYGHPHHFKHMHHIPSEHHVNNQIHQLQHQSPPHTMNQMHSMVHLGPHHPHHPQNDQVILTHLNPVLINGHGLIPGQIISGGQMSPNGSHSLTHLPPHYDEYRSMPPCPSAELQGQEVQQQASSSISQSPQKKRKMSEGLSSKGSPGEAVALQNLVHIKRDPGGDGPSSLPPAIILPPSTSGGSSPDGGNATGMTQCEEDFGFGYNASGGGGDGASSVYGLGPEYQCIRFTPFLPQNWHILLDASMKEVQVNYRVDADKGFNFSNADEAFVCQKKNHFQVTVHVLSYGLPRFVKTAEGIKKIDAFFVHFYGCKTESPAQTIKVEQSQSDRSKKPFHPQPVELIPEQPSKMTVGRLHFSETTSNNMRKKGKPNPDQRYFHLVVTLAAHSGDQVYHIVSHASERIIVRASNPGQFENDIEQSWQKGTTPDSIFHAGRVGINTDRPDEPLVVHGNIKVTGHIIQPSDRRAKTDIEEMDTKEQLRNVANMRIVKYNFKSEFADSVGLNEGNIKGTGVLAQEVQQIIPDAVKPAGDMLLSNGEKIENFLVVNTDRIFMENVGAVKELCKVTDNLETRIDELERMNNKLRKINRFDSIKSVVSGSSSVASASTVTCHSSYSSAPQRIHNNHRRCLRGACLHHKNKDIKCRCRSNSTGSSQEICSNRFMQTIIMILVLIMAFCLAAMATLYILEFHQKRHNPVGQPYYVLPINHVSPSTSIMHSPPVGTTNMIHASPSVPSLSLHPPVDSVPSHNNAIHSSTQDKQPSRDKSTGSPSSSPGQHFPPPQPASSTLRPSSTRPTMTRRIPSRATDSPSLLHRTFTQSIVPNPSVTGNPFNDLNDNGKGSGHKVNAEDLNSPESSVPNKSLSSGVSDAVSNTLSNPDKEVSV